MAPRSRSELARALSSLRTGAAQPVLSMLDAGLDPNATDEDGRPLLHGAVSAGSVEVVASLLEHGAGVDQRDPEALTALHVLCFAASPEIAVLELLK